MQIESMSVTLENIKQLLDDQKSSLLEEFDSRLDLKNSNAIQESDAAHSAKVSKLEDSVGQMEDYLRIENLIIHHLPPKTPSDFASVVGQKESPNDLLAYVTELFNHILGNSPDDNPYHDNYPISTLHRLPLSPFSKSQYQPIIVRFYLRNAKNLLMGKRKNAGSFLKADPNKKKVFIADHLGPTSLKLLKDVKQLQSKKIINDCWIYYSKFYVKDLNDKVHVCSLSRLNVLKTLEDIGVNLSSNHGYKSII